MNSPFDPREDRLQVLLANAFAQQQAQEFLSRRPADAGSPKSELLTPVHQGQCAAVAEMGSTDSFLERLQEVLDQTEPENGVLELDPPAPAMQNASDWLAEASAPATTRAHGNGQAVGKSEAQSVAIGKPASGNKWSLARLHQSAGIINARRLLGARRRPDAQDADGRRGNRAGRLYAILAILAGCVIGLGLARQGSKASLLRPAAALPSQTKPQASNAPALSAAPVPQPATGPVLISDITSFTKASSAQVTIDLQGPVKYRAYRLHNPERLYFDLQYAELAPSLLGRSVVLDGSFVRKIRSAQRGPDVSRVTLETEGRCQYQASILPDPYRLIIELSQRPSARK